MYISSYGQKQKKSFPETQVGFLQEFKPSFRQNTGDTGVDRSTCIVLHETTPKRGQSKQRERAQGNTPGFTKGCCFAR